MSSKKVSIGSRPTSQPASAAADEWVNDKPEPMKRLTIDIPASLHRAIKSQCAARGSKISDEVRELLLQKYGED